jgi:uncharacterized protein
MKEEIIRNIKDLERENNIKVIFLIESGSRAWGWESKDSDYDVRGVYIQDYDTFEEEKKQVEIIKGKIDIVLWDLKKFIKLYSNSNPSVWEWLSSDIIYLDNNYFQELKKIFEKDYNEFKLKKHYLSMAQQNFDKYINSFSSVNLKKYVYIIRSIACINFIDKERLPPPKNYKDILNYIPKNVQNFFKKIIKDKINSENINGKRNKEVDDYISSYWSADFEKEKDRFNIEALNIIFKKIVKENKL